MDYSGEDKRQETRDKRQGAQQLGIQEKSHPLIGSKKEIMSENKKRISSSYPKIMGKTNFQPWEFPEVGQKQKTEKNRERSKVGNNNGQVRIANATSGGAR